MTEQVPPRLAGLRYLHRLGQGASADVLAYEQDRPRRLVAVKVLHHGLDPAVGARFLREADLMAQVQHPSIVTVLQTATAEDGRPCIVMEHCSGPALAARYRRERMAVDEVLRIGVQLASAVETAHRAGIRHRDIKPGNVLTTDLGRAALTDFGIAEASVGVPGGGGLSVPWAPPELLAEGGEGDERADVYSLAATLYSLLAGRTPFEVPGAANGVAELLARIGRTPVPPVGRGDVPPALEAVLARAMAKDPARRHASALAVAHALQAVEHALGLPVTPVEVQGEDGRAALGSAPRHWAGPTRPADLTPADDGAPPVDAGRPGDRTPAGDRTPGGATDGSAPVGVPARLPRSVPAPTGQRAADAVGRPVLPGPAPVPAVERIDLPHEDLPDLTRSRSLELVEDAPAGVADDEAPAAVVDPPGGPTTGARDGAAPGADAGAAGARSADPRAAA
ncbi:serine/threonine-protein kinase, partial [Cellulomonas endophytica]|uniref:serine/threonine-protein kinase n=1 Tax=Cellulomonas endophytica TaxID=2494735 RepID=UPI00196A752B